MTDTEYDYNPEDGLPIPRPEAPWADGEPEFHIAGYWLFMQLEKHVGNRQMTRELWPEFLKQLKNSIPEWVEEQICVFTIETLLSKSR